MSLIASDVKVPGKRAPLVSTKEGIISLGGDVCIVLYFVCTNVHLRFL
ncbi:unnamed protein product [Brassica oleracea var. botrytis]